MVRCKSLLVMLATASAVVAGPCKPSTTSPVLTTTISAIEQTSTTTTSALGDTTVVDTATVSDDTTTVATTTTAGADINTIATTTTTEAETTTTSLITTSAEADVTTTTTVAETTSTAPCAAAPTACGVYGYFAAGNTLQYLTSPGTKDSAKDCLQACADYPGCDVADFYNEAANGWPKGNCEFFKGTVKTDGAQTPYQWYQVCCLAEM